MTGPVPKTAELGFRSSGETEQTGIQTTYKWSPSAEMKTCALCLLAGMVELAARRCLEERIYFGEKVTGPGLERQVDLWCNGMVDELRFRSESFKA